MSLNAINNSRIKYSWSCYQAVMINDSDDALLTQYLAEIDRFDELGDKGKVFSVLRPQNETLSNSLLLYSL